MKEVRELRYDAEDFFDEVRRSCAGGGDGDGARGSALLAVMLCIPLILRILLWIRGKLKRRCHVAQAFSDLRARAKDASQRRQSFQICPATIKPEFGEANVSRCKSPQLVDLEESMERLVKLLAFDSEDAEQQVQVVPIFGSAGVGKTTLARTFYRNFGGKFDCRAFVRVSRNPDMRRMLSSMLSQIKAPPVHGFPDVQDLIDHIREYLQCKRYLIVIDDLWASSTWDIISCAFPDGDCCSRIIVTTEIEDVALACSRYQFKYMYDMSPLNGDQSRKLFLGRVFGSESGCPPDFKEVTHEIIRKCGGLPLAIENIASMLACELDVDQWKHVRDSLPSVLSLRTSPSLEGLKEVFNIIYNNLSPCLKTCLLYLMYPEGNTISKEDLVKQWVAEDFIGEGQNREQTARDYFDELVSRGMIEPVDINYNDEVLTCTVHHMVLDLITYKSLEENFIINVSYFQTTPGLPDKVRRLSVQFGGAKCASIPSDFMMTQVRSLVYFGFYNCVPSIVEYKLLRVLILHIWADQCKIFDLTRISELFQLRYLKIDCNITVHLPDEIRQLKFMETLELHAPVNDMPSDISCLSLLRSLGYFDLSKNSIENVQSLGELNNLQNLHLTWSNTAKPDNLKNSMQCLGSILWKLSNLKSLTLVPAASSHADVLDDAGGPSVGISGDVLSSVSSPPALLQRLELSGRCCIFSSLPEWTKELGNLCILKIAVTKLPRKDIDILKGLPSLSALSLYVWATPVGKVVFDNEGFSVLKYFKFTCAAPCVAFLKGAMPSVRELKLAFNANRMEQYGQIVAGLEYLIELKEITAKVGGTGADDSDTRYTEAALSCAMAHHPCTPIIRVQCVDRNFYGEDTSAIQEQEHWTVQEELLDKNLASVLANRDLSHIRSLTLTSSSYIKYLPSLAWFGNLGVLDLEGCDRLENYHTKGVGMLFQLKYLSFRGTWISHLPSEVLILHNLEFLDITDTHIEVLPAGIAHLPKLRYLIAPTNDGRAGVEIPNGIRSMKNLWVLLGSDTSSGSLDAHEELGNLINLSELDIKNTGSLGAIGELGNLTNLNLEYGKIGSEYNWYEEFPSLVGLSLCKVGMCWRSSWSPLSFSNQRFEMSSCYNLRCIPERISPALNHLKYLEITKVEVTEKDLRILGEMPALLYLGLTCQTFIKERLIFHGTGFPRLKEFVYDAAVLPSGNLLFKEGALPLLKDLVLVYSVSVVDAYGFHLGIEHLPRLKNAQVRLYKEGATSSDITSAEVAIMNEADAHPNRPRVTLIEYTKRVLPPCHNIRRFLTLKTPYIMGQRE